MQALTDLSIEFNPRLRKQELLDLLNSSITLTPETITGEKLFQNISGKVFTTHDEFANVLFIGSGECYTGSRNLDPNIFAEV